MYLANARAERGLYTASEASVVSLALARRAREEMRTWPGYGATPLRRLGDWAAELGLGDVAYKDEAARFGLGSFKALGGAYAAKLLVDQVIDTGVPAHRLHLCCATDGNHGRSVAFFARTRGIACTVFMHEGAPHDKAVAIEALGGDVVRTPGVYDDSVAAARFAAQANGWLLVADTSDDPDDETPAQVMRGYGVMVLEALEQAGTERLATHVFLQAGCGGLAAAVAGLLAELYGEHRPTIVVVEPQAAACLMQSARDGFASRVGGDLRTSMAMLSCGAASALAWTVLERRADAFMTIADRDAEAAAARLNAQGVSVGVSGAAGLAGLLVACRDAGLRRRLNLGRDARVWVFGTEGA